ncbi:MAG: glycoside hydrolase family 2 protein, partial [Bacteroidaceae bacterium]|nr:glycoside hydrolase family 2 protein [Bacteroidaceae bacterium]
MRKETDFNSDWLFYKGEEFAEGNWESVVLPHTWNAFDGQDGGGDYYQGVAWYKKTFEIENGLKEVYISFGAASKMADVWCNNKYVGQHRGGFSSFVFNLTSFLKEGKNEIKVKVNNNNDLPIYPRSADFTFFGGLYRGVKLLCFDSESHFDVESFGVNGLFIKPDA